MTRPDDEAEELLENDEDRRFAKADDSEIVIRLSGFTVSRNCTPKEAAKDVLKQSVQGTIDQTPNQPKVWFEQISCLVQLAN